MDVMFPAAMGVFALFALVFQFAFNVLAVLVGLWIWHRWPIVASLGTRETKR